MSQVLHSRGQFISQLAKQQVLTNTVALVEARRQRHTYSRLISTFATYRTSRSHLPIL